MKLEDQVLLIEQVQEFQKLGFDINKYASMCWVKLFDHDNFYRILNKEFAELNDYTPTMTIGDIIEILPEKIYNNYSLEISKNYVDPVMNERQLRVAKELCEKYETDFNVAINDFGNIIWYSFLK